MYVSFPSLDNAASLKSLSDATVGVIWPAETMSRCRLFRCHHDAPQICCLPGDIWQVQEKSFGGQNIAGGLTGTGTELGTWSLILTIREMGEE